MKANELMIDDWVECVDSTHKKKVYAQIEAIEEGQTCILVRLGNCNWFLDISFIKPIPLTIKIIEKNGIMYKWGMLWYQGRYDETGFEFHFNNDCTMHLQYVHELQHALRLCGIEKEIEL